MDKHQAENDEQNEKVPENLKFKEVLSTGVTGKVKWFNVKLGYGFVCRNDNQEDIFIHQSAIVKSNPEHPRKSVEDGEEILFDVVKGVKGNEAANVTGIGGNCVKGSEYALRFPRNRGRGRISFRGQGRRRNGSENMKRSQDYYRGGGRPNIKRPNVAQTQASTGSESRETKPPPKEKPVVLTSIRGKVKWFNVKLGYGFVCRADNNQDIFIHQTAITKSNPQHSRKSVENGEEILFDIVQGEKGFETANVSAPNGECVKGSEYALRYPRMQGIDRGRGRGRGLGGGGERNRFRGGSEDEGGRFLPDFYPDGVRGRPFPMRRSFRGIRYFPPGRPFRGGRTYGGPFMGGPYNFDMMNHFYEYPNEYDLVRMPRGGGRMKSGGMVKEGPMGMEGPYFERGGPMVGRSRNKGRGRPRRAGGVGPRGHMTNGVSDEVEVQSESDPH